MLATVTSNHWVTLHGLVVFLGLTVFAIASHTRRQRRHPSASIAWIISLALLPYLSLPLYLLVGTRKNLIQAPSRVMRLPPARPHHSNDPAKIFQDLASAMDLPPVMSLDQLVIHEDGRAALQSLRSVIDGAVQTLDVCTFLIGSDVLGDEIIESLVRKAQQGVQVRLLIDGLGIYLGGKLHLQKLSAAGVRVQLFAPPLRSPMKGHINLRNHRKMVIADQQKTWTGGRNLAAEYFVGDAALRPPKAAWIDLSFDFGGELACQCHRQFEQDWQLAIRARKDTVYRSITVTRSFTKQGAQFIPSGPDQHDDTVYSLLISSCFNAKKRIVATTPYFVPDATFLMALTLAARRGVEVDLLLPRQSNHRLADIARHAALREMSGAGARIWMLPGMIHAKAIVIDDELALTGSANLDERSFFLNYELMIAFFNPSDIELFSRWIEAQRKHATSYLVQPPNVFREFVEGMVRWVAFQL